MPSPSSLRKRVNGQVVPLEPSSRCALPSLTSHSLFPSSTKLPTFRHPVWHIEYIIWQRHQVSVPWLPKGYQKGCEKGYKKGCTSASPRSDPLDASCTCLVASHPAPTKRDRTPRIMDLAARSFVGDCKHQSHCWPAGDYCRNCLKSYDSCRLSDSHALFHHSEP